VSETRPGRRGSAEEDRVLDHEYDGIHEYDNPMPRWWLNVLYATIVFSVLYLLNFIPAVGEGPGRIANYEADMARAREARAAEAAKAGPVTAEALLALTRDATAMSQARERFQSTCAPCHRADGGGNIGPNLTDDFWIHGGSPVQIAATVTHGVPEKGMPPWGPVLKPAELSAVVAYVTTLRGTHPAHPKEPQGDRYAPSASDAAGGARADSTRTRL
jgi:cytochrome c oxidase cbb3-type subunit 3